MALAVRRLEKNYQFPTKNVFFGKWIGKNLEITSLEDSQVFYGYYQGPQPESQPSPRLILLPLQTGLARGGTAGEFRGPEEISIAKNGLSMDA